MPVLGSSSGKTTLPSEPDSTDSIQSNVVIGTVPRRLRIASDLCSAIRQETCSCNAGTVQGAAAMSNAPGAGRTALHRAWHWCMGPRPDDTHGTVYAEPGPQ